MMRVTYCNTICKSQNFLNSHPYSVPSYWLLILLWVVCYESMRWVFSRGRWRGQIRIRRFFFFRSYYFVFSVFFRWLMVIGIAFEGFALVWYLALLANAKPCKLLSTVRKNAFAQICSLKICCKYMNADKLIYGKHGKCHICLVNNLHPPGIYYCLQYIYSSAYSIYIFVTYLQGANLVKSIFSSSVK